jgi:hypothetical protein
MPVMQDAIEHGANSDWPITRCDGWVAHPSAFFVFAEGGDFVFKSVFIHGKKDSK